MAGAAVARAGAGQFGEQGIAILLFLMVSMDVDDAFDRHRSRIALKLSIGAALAAIAVGGTVVASMAAQDRVSTRLTRGAR